MADGFVEAFEGGFGGVSKGDLSAGAVIVSAAGAPAGDEAPDDAVGLAGLLIGAEGKEKGLGVQAAAEGPGGVFVAEEEVSDFADHVGVLDGSEVGEDSAGEDAGVFEGLAEHAPIGALDLAALDVAEETFVGEGEEEQAGFGVGATRSGAKVAGVGANAVEEGGGEFDVRDEVGGEQVLGEDGGGGAVGTADVVERGVAGVGAAGVVVDDDVGDDMGREGVISGAGLGIDEGDAVELVEVDLSEGSEVELEVVEEGAVFGAADDAGRGDGTGDLGEVVGQEAEGQGGGEGVGVGIILQDDEEVRAALEGGGEFFEFAPGLGGGLHRWEELR